MTTKSTDGPIAWTHRVVPSTDVDTGTNGGAGWLPVIRWSTAHRPEGQRIFGRSVTKDLRKLCRKPTDEKGRGNRTETPI